MPCTKCTKIKKLICPTCNPLVKVLDQYFGTMKWWVLGSVVLLLMILVSCSAVSPFTAPSAPSIGGFLASTPDVPKGTDGGVGASVGSFSWVGAIMMLLGAAGMMTGFAEKKASITCLCIGMAIAGTPLLLAYVGQTILQWSAAGLALIGLSIVACMAYRRWRRALNGNGKNT
jgi:hypothetical protein